MLLLRGCSVEGHGLRVASARLFCVRVLSWVALLFIGMVRENCQLVAVVDKNIEFSLLNETNVLSLMTEIRSKMMPPCTFWLHIHQF